MKSIKGVAFVSLILVLSIILWSTAQPIESLDIYGKLSYIVGGLAITSFSLTFILSVRNALIEKWFNGFEKVYFSHKILAVFSVALTFLHEQLLELADEEKERMDFRDGGEFESNLVSGIDLSHFAGELGEIARNGFIFLILVAFFAKFLKYEHWRYIHRLMIIPFAIGIFHMYFTGIYDLFTVSPLAIFTAVMTIAGIASGLYMLGIYQRLQFKYKGKITNINKVGANAVELEITLNKKINYQAGQFIFLKIFQNGIEQAPHPFSISGGDGQKIFVTIKALGDFTKKVNEAIELNTKVTIEGPYGHLNLEKGQNKQIWIAGGVGITPFLSYLKTKSINHDIELFYTYRGQDDAIYKNFLEEYAKNNPQFKVNFIDTTTMERLNFENYFLPDQARIIMCGPKKMVENFTKQLKDNNQQIDITFEAFQFR